MKVWITRDKKGCGDDKYIFIWRKKPYCADGIWQEKCDAEGWDRFFSEKMLFVLSIVNFKKSFNPIPPVYGTIKEDKLILSSFMEKILTSDKK